MMNYLKESNMQLKRLRLQEKAILRVLLSYFQAYWVYLESDLGKLKHIYLWHDRHTSNFKPLKVQMSEL